MGLSLKVYQHDVDWGGIVYHANYLRFFDQARTEWWHDWGFTRHLFGAREQLAFTVVDIHIRYLSPAFLHDDLMITTQLLSVKDTSLAFKQALLRKETCLAEAEITQVCVSIHDGRPVTIPADIREAFCKAGFLGNG
ncbi:YbgC/FadM family acyl-CoA thioesterase [Enterobacter cloacae]|uniref:YbgC/FadM family acyl-CoA thioesterase n=1 Tax=Enterobacter cloacae TaxID=550 RepID=UPI0025425EB9|nr:YbgC/FadM family acyl-CoA thioesterase [Enterobacter cloacae]WIF62940.1 YbgC/FadM family acyl-CoA thioesterase [Enterobacter cloacae]